MLPGPLGRAGDAPPPPGGGTPSPQGKEGKPGRAAKIAGRRLKRSGGARGEELGTRGRFELHLPWR